MTNAEADRLRICCDCGEPNAALWRTTKAENPGRLLRVCRYCEHRWTRWGLVERDPIAGERDWSPQTESGRHLDPDGGAR